MSGCRVPNDVAQSVTLALAEDVGSGDITAALVPAAITCRATLVSREEAVVCGVPWATEVLEQIGGGRVKHRWLVRDGQHVGAGQTLAEFEGSAQALLTAERTLLNFLQTLSATATETRRYVDAVAHTRARILDTRKTLPGLRAAQKYAVCVGGGHNHRFGLFDAVLIKENHIVALGSVAAAVRAGRSQGHAVEVEVETLAELTEALDAGAETVLLDNFSLDDIRTAVALVAGRAKIEVSGGVTLASVVEVAETGVDFISVGALTKNIRAVDLSLRFVFPVQ